jgi:hypothetical protein
LRARSAFQVESATIATPGRRPFRLFVPSTMKASFTPGMALIASRLALTRTAAQHRALHVAGVQHAGQARVDAEQRLAGHHRPLSTPPMRVPSRR